MKLTRPGDPPPEAYAIHRKHYWLHLMSGVAVFGLGIVADVVVGELRWRSPHRVRWLSTGPMDGHRLDWPKDTNFWLNTTNRQFNIDVGFSDDGTVYWRLKP